MAVKRKKKTVLEKTVEAELTRRVKELGGECLKVTVLGRRGFFDRLIFLPGGRIILAELKRPVGGKLSPHQMRYAAILKKLGARVAIVRDSADIGRLLSPSS